MTAGFVGEACVNYILNQGQQVYVVCPAIDLEDVDDDEKIKLCLYLRLKTCIRSCSPNATIATLDGKMRPLKRKRCWRNLDLERHRF